MSQLEPREEDDAKNSVGLGPKGLGRLRHRDQHFSCLRIRSLDKSKKPRGRQDYTHLPCSHFCQGVSVPSLVSGLNPASQNMREDRRFAADKISNSTTTLVPATHYIQKSVGSGWSPPSRYTFMVADS